MISAFNLVTQSMVSSANMLHLMADWLQSAQLIISDSIQSAITQIADICDVTISG